MADGDAIAVTMGTAFTVTVTVAVPLHPAADVPVTVYVVVEDGLIVCEVPDPSPWLHEYEDAPEAFRLEL